MISRGSTLLSSIAVVLRGIRLSLLVWISILVSVMLLFDPDINDRQKHTLGQYSLTEIIGMYCQAHD